MFMLRPAPQYTELTEVKIVRRSGRPSAISMFLCVPKPLLS